MTFISMLLHCSSARSGNGDAFENVATNLNVPWAIDFLPDGGLIFTERMGVIKTVHGEGFPREVGRISVAAQNESGLLGIAVDPAFQQNRYVYIYYTYNNEAKRNRVSRFTLRETLENETILIDLIPAASIHDGGRMKFGPDGLLYITTGDAGHQPYSGDTNSLAGKILRIHKDGSIPSDNPFNNAVYALGLRNPQGLAWHNGQLYASDHGPSSHDEINQIQKGGDYGWPRTCDEVPAFRCYTGFTLAPSGIAINGNYLYVAGLRGNQLRRIDLNTGAEEVLHTNMGRLREVVFHNGMLYFTTSNRDGRGNPRQNDDRIVRIAPQAGK